MNKSSSEILALKNEIDLLKKNLLKRKITSKPLRNKKNKSSIYSDEDETGRHLVIDTGSDSDEGSKEDDTSQQSADKLIPQKSKAASSQEENKEKTSEKNTYDHKKKEMNDVEIYITDDCGPSHSTLELERQSVRISNYLLMELGIKTNTLDKSQYIGISILKFKKNSFNQENKCFVGKPLDLTFSVPTARLIGKTIDSFLKTVDESDTQNNRI
jgi:hypothetical protein